MSHKERILTFLTDRPGLWFDDDELAEALQIHPRQQVYTLCRHLHASGRIQREKRDGKLRNSALVSTATASIAATVALNEKPSGGSMTPAQFEALAETVLGKHYGVKLAQGSVQNVPKRFDLVSADGQFVGDAKYYTLVRGENLPPAKFSVIAEHVWLLEKTGAPYKFLVFGNDRRVPEQWLNRYDHLVTDVAFYFLSSTGDLERLQ